MNVQGSWLNKLLEGLIAKVEKSKFVPVLVIGVGCTGLINEDGSIEAGSQTLPGNRESSLFNLHCEVTAAIPMIEIAIRR